MWQAAVKPVALRAPRHGGGSTRTAQLPAAALARERSGDLRRTGDGGVYTATQPSSGTRLRTNIGRTKTRFTPRLQRSSRAARFVANVAAERTTGVEVPNELIQIQAYVLWEEQGKPEGLSPDQQLETFNEAKDKLEQELRNGGSINNIRARFNLAPIEEPKPPTPPPPPPSPPPSPPPQKQESKTGKRAPPPPPKRADTKPQPAAVMLPSQQEAKEAAKDAPAGGEQHFQFHVGSKSLIQVVVTPGEVAMTTTLPTDGDLLLHWGLQVNGVEGWVLPDDSARPPNTKQYKDRALQTTWRQADGYQWIRLASPPDATHLQFVLNDVAHGAWYEASDRESWSVPLMPSADARTAPVADTPPPPPPMLQPQPEQQAQRVEAEVAPAAPVAPMPPPAPVYTEGGYERRERDLSKLFECQEEMCVAARAAAQSVMTRWAREPSKDSTVITSQRIVPLNGEGEVLLEVKEYLEDDPEATSKRKRVVKRDVVMTTDCLDPLALHWGVARDEPGQWILAPPELRPEKTVALDAIACETPFYLTQGCFGAGDDECVPMQKLVITFPGTGEQYMGIQFVARKTGKDEWFQDMENGNSNFTVTFDSPMDSLLEKIIRAETGPWWTLMHRCKLCSSLMTKALEGKNPEADLSKLFVWMRLSALKQLTWQRNYNTKPRELSAAQAALTSKFADFYKLDPTLRPIMQMFMETLGRGGEGGDGQKIRDDILNIMHKHSIGEDKKFFIEQWHQKLHNNTTPDDVVICEAYIAYLKADCNLDAYWAAIHAGGLSKEALAAYDRPIVTEPIPRMHIRDSLIKDFNEYLSVLKRVHGGADLGQCIEKVKGRAPIGLQNAMGFVSQRRQDSNVVALLAGCVECRHEIRDAGMVDPGADTQWVRELLYLDVAVERVARLAVERAPKDMDLEQQLTLIALVAENLCLSLHTQGEELVYCISMWKKLQAMEKRDREWALLAKAVLERISFVVSTYADKFNVLMQPTAEQIGAACGCDEWTIKLFSEEVVRGGPGFALSMLMQKIDPVIRDMADMGKWQIISPTAASGYVYVVDDLSTIQHRVFERPTVVIAKHVSGAEEIPMGATAVLSGSSVDVLSHSAVRARNSKVFFATCYDAEVTQSLVALEGQGCEVRIQGGDNVIVQQVDKVDDGSVDETASAKVTAGLAVKVPPPCKDYALAMSAFNSDVVGAKSRNTLALQENLGGGKLPSWINLPYSVAVPFGAMERVLDLPDNADAKAELQERIAAIDTSSEEALADSLSECREVVKFLELPEALQKELAAAMKESGMYVPEDDEDWARAYTALRGVWASKWTERAYISVRNVGINHADLRMSVLVQEIIPADYAFVIHTVNPSTDDADEIYAEVVLGLGEVLVGNFPGRALSFVCRKDAMDAPKVVGYPSKSVGQFIERCAIFRSDSNGEDLEGYAGAGLYDSLPMMEATERVVDYTNEPLVFDEQFRMQLLAQIAKVGLAVEQALGGPQDIEGVVKDGEVFVVQTRPQV